MRFVRYRMPNGLVFWRFLTANHRIVAVSAQGFEDAERAAASIRVVQAFAEQASIDFSSDRGGMWTWAIRKEGLVVATSAHPYGRRREADSAAQRFRRLAPLAGMDDWVAERGEQRPTPRPALDPKPSAVRRSPGWEPGRSLSAGTPLPRYHTLGQDPRDNPRRLSR